MRCARDGAQPPRELTLAWQVDRWHALPEAGGLLDQPAGLLQNMLVVSNVYNAFIAFKQNAGNLMQLASTQPKVLSIVRDIELLEAQTNG